MDLTQSTFRSPLPRVGDLRTRSAGDRPREDRGEAVESMALELLRECEAARRLHQQAWIALLRTSRALEDLP